MRARTAIVLLAGAIAACGREDAKPAGGAPAVDRFARTTFAAHTRVPIEPGKNAIWCATFQLAWDGIADAVGGRLELGKPAPAEDVAEMNKRTFPHGDLAPASCVAVGGLVRDGVLDRIRTEMTAKFPSELLPAIPAGPDAAVGFAFLAKDLKFEFPFEDLAEPIRFAGGEKRVRAFGLETDAKGAAAEKALAQIVWHNGDVGKTFVRFAELLLASREDRLFLARMPPPGTLEDAWQAVAGILASGGSQVLKTDGQNLAIPMIDFDAVHQFEQFVGAPISGAGGGSLREARQRIRCRLDRTGAVVRSEGRMVGYLGMDDYTFDVPMLVALMQKGASRPYFLMWLGNDDLMVGSEDAHADIGALVGRWRMTPPADAAQGEGIDLTIRADRTATLEVTLRNQHNVIEGSIQTAGDRAFFAARSMDGEPATGKRARRVPLRRTASGLSIDKVGRNGGNWDFTRAE